MRSRVLASFLLGVMPLLFACPEPNPPPSGCRSDDDCSLGRICSDGACIECLENGHCDDGGFCCGGFCQAADQLDESCGCAAESGGAPGVACDGTTQFCLVGGAPATIDNVAEGTCSCPCDAAAGGTICSVDESSALVCSCDTADDEGTCGRPALDDAGRPHVVADTCTPGAACVCFANGTAPCDPDGAAPDCSSSGCVDILGDENNCGVGGRVCTVEETGVADSGLCLDGGCSCNNASDCQGTGLNVDLCAFVGDVSQCVCEGYEIEDGVKAPCPLGLECGAAGCLLDGTPYSTRAALLGALGVPL